MFDRCILHIGTEKTGTTSLQAFLALNRDALAGQGVFVPRRMGVREHIGFAEMVIDPSKGFRRGYLPLDQLDAAGQAEQARQRAAILAELEVAKTSGGRVLVISSERLGVHVNSPAEIDRLKALLAPLARRIEVVIYLRPQVEFAISLYSTELRAGGTRRAILPNLAVRPELRRRYDYMAKLAFWAEAWPEAALRPLLFLPAEMPEGDVVRDFLTRLDLPAEGMVWPPKENTAMSAKAQAMLLAANLRQREQPQKGFDRAGLVRRLQAAYPGPAALPARRAATAFHRHFIDSNAALQARWFPDRTGDVLPFQARTYPIDAGTITLTAEDMTTLDRLMAGSQGPLSKLKSKILKR